jgi:hypothetical protein
MTGAITEDLSAIAGDPQSLSHSDVKPDVMGFYDAPTGSIQYIVADPSTRKCADVHGGVVERQRHLVGTVAIDFENDTHIAIENEQGTRVNGARNSGGFPGRGHKMWFAKIYGARRVPFHRSR